MKTITLALSAVTGLAAATVALASPASATPSVVGSAGPIPLHQCAVIGLGPGCEIIPPATGHEGTHDPVQQVVPTKVYVDVTC